MIGDRDIAYGSCFRKTSENCADGGPTYNHGQCNTIYLLTPAHELSPHKLKSIVRLLIKLLLSNIDLKWRWSGFGPYVLLSKRFRSNFSHNNSS